MIKEPKKLYHYTDINKLALILESRSIRFGRLDKVNDPMEGLSNDFHSMAQYIFISSWTSNEVEELALWNMYTPSMRGVRIELPLPIFENKSISIYTDRLCSDKEWINNDLGYFILSGQNLPEAMLYTDNEEKLTPNIKNGEGLQLAQLGKYKRSMWIVEQEYRYRLNIVPIDKKVQSNDYADKYSRLVQQQLPPPIDGYFIKIDDEAFRNMRIRLGPKLLPGDTIIVDSLVNGLNPTAIVENSVFAGLIR